MAHPDLLARTLGPHAVEQRTALGHIDKGAAEFAMVRIQHLAAELGHHGLLAVADAKHRHAGLEHNIGRARGTALGDAGGPAGEDEGARPEGGDAGRVRAEGPDFAINAALAQPAGNELGDLAAEIEDQHAVSDGLGSSGGR